MFVDARNVIRSRWPNIDESRFVQLARAWAEQEGVRLLLVFDGPAPGEGLDIVGTGRESADDVIAWEALARSQEGDRLWLVSSDRGLRARVTPYVERMIGGGAFATELAQ